MKDWVAAFGKEDFLDTPLKGISTLTMVLPFSIIDRTYLNANDNNGGPDDDFLDFLDEDLAEYLLYLKQREHKPTTI